MDFLWKTQSKFPGSWALSSLNYLIRTRETLVVNNIVVTVLTVAMGETGLLNLRDPPKQTIDIAPKLG